MVRRLGTFALLGAVLLLFMGQVPHRRQGSLKLASTSTPFGPQMGMYAGDTASAITYQGRTPWGRTTTTAMALAPPTCQDNDLLILVAHCRGNTDMSVDNSYSTLIEGNGNSTNRLGVYYKITTGSEATTNVSGGSNGQMAAIFVFRGVDTTNPFADYTDVRSWAADNGTPDVQFDGGELFATSDSSMVVLVVGSQDDNTHGSQSGACYIEIADSIQAGGTPDTAMMLAVGKKTQRGGVRGTVYSQASLGFDAHVSMMLVLQKDPP